MNRHVLIMVSIQFSLLTVTAGRVWAQSLDQANREFLEHRIDKAFALYEAVAGDDGDPAERAEAASMAALIQWRFHRKHEEAVQLLEAAMARGCERLPPLLALSRLERDRGNFEKAWSAASRAVKEAKGSDETHKARIERAWVVVEECVNAAVHDRHHCDSRQLEEVRTDLLGLVEDDENLLDVSQLLLQAAILLGDGEAALRAWRSYFRIDPEEKAYGILALPQKDLANLWPTWKGASGGQEVNYRLITCLADSRLYEEAVILGHRYGIDDDAPDAIKDIMFYGDAMLDLKEFMGEQYRRYFGAQTDPKDTLAGFVDRLCALWNKSSWSTRPCPAPTPFDLTDPTAMTGGLRALREFANRFGMIVRVGADGADLSVGHAIVQETREIEQYGHRARFTYYLLDSIVANGWTAWATDGRSRYGGWLTVFEDGFAQIRRAYVNSPIAAWKRAADPEARTRFEWEIARDSEEDWITAEQDPHAYLPGLACRLELAAYDGLLQQLKGDGLEGVELRSTFISRIEKANVESAIYAHEGRHMIDKQLGIRNGAELEYRAKLSEVAFATIPRLAFGSILTDEIGKNTPHGQANLRIVRGIVSWMQANSGEIRGIDTARPLLPQFDLLSDKQMREVMRSMDSLAANSG